MESFIPMSQMKCCINYLKFLNLNFTQGKIKRNYIVAVPVIQPLQFILDEIAAKPKKDAYVFPQIFHSEEDELKRRKLTVQENSNIKDRVIRVCKEVLKCDKEPSGTWARHSFVTNLKLAGVEELYIAESMGHSGHHSISDRYIANYPLDKQSEYNSLCWI